MALSSRTCQSSYVNLLTNFSKEQDELTGAQEPARRSNTGSDEALTKVPNSPEALTPPLVPLLAKNFFTKFMKVFMKMTQA